MTQLTEHFTLEELTRTDTGLPNEPDPTSRANLSRIANALEAVRAVCGGRAVHVSSGFRSEAVNARVGGSSTSAHRFGLAADFTIFGQPIADTFRLLRRSGIVFDQLILEPSWIHIGLSEGYSRQQALIKVASGYEVAP